LKNIEFNKVISKKLLPDEAFVNEVEKMLYIIEKKFQHQPGTVDEKLQTCDFKLKQYKKLANLNGYDVKYIYLLSDWFKQDQYKDVLEYINSVNCYYYFNEISIDVLGI
jgi:hypothetical protein